MVTVKELERQFYKQFGPQSEQHILAVKALDAESMEDDFEKEMDAVTNAQCRVFDDLMKLSISIDEFVDSEDAPDHATLTAWGEQLSSAMEKLQ